MNISYKDTPSEKGQIILAALRSAVMKALERKRKLGQYAVIWDGEKVVKIGEEAKGPE